MFQALKVKANKVFFLGGLVLFFCLLFNPAFAVDMLIAVSVTPLNGSSAANTPVKFTATYADTGGANKFSDVYLMIDTELRGDQAFFGRYNLQQNKLYLRNDLGTDWMPESYSPGTPARIENSYAVLDCARTTISSSGNTLSVTWGVSFKLPFAGAQAKNVYIYAADSKGTDTSWQFKGIWGVRSVNASPLAVSVTPLNGSSAVNTAVSFTSTYTDADGANNLSDVYLMIDVQQPPRGDHCFFGRYNLQGNKLYLRNDKGDDWVSTSSPPGTAVTIDNTYVSLDCAGTTVSSSGNTLSVTWRVAFKPPFAATQDKNVYSYAADSDGASSSWQWKGRWNVKTAVKYTLNLSISGNGSTDPAAGAHTYDPQSSVTITAFPQSGNTFVNWSGDVPAAKAKDNPLVLILDSNKTITANFALKDITPPTGSIRINNDALYTSSISVVLNLSAQDDSGGSGLSQMRFSYDNLGWTNPEDYAATKSWPLPTGDGLKTVYVKFSDRAGNWSKEYSDAITLDTTPPTAPIVIDEGVTTYDTARLHCHWESSDPGSGISEYQYMISEGSPSGTVIVDWTSAGTSNEITRPGLNLKTGSTYYFSVKAKNGAGLWSGISYSDGITVTPADTTPPTGSIKINNGASYTNSTAVTLTLSAQDNSGGSGLSQMRFSNDNSNWSNPESYAASKSWTLASGDGSKAVYVKYGDVAGNWSQSYSASIILDTTPPQITLNPIKTPSNQPVSLSYSVSDNFTPTDKIVILGDQSPYVKEGNFSITLSAYDLAGNLSSVIANFTIDKTPPTGSIKINNGSQNTNTAAVTLNLSAQDPGGSGVALMIFSNDRNTWSNPESYVTTKSWTLTSGNGAKTVYVKFSDNAGNWSDVYSAAITVITTPTDTTPPTGSIRINNGASYTNSTAVTLTLSAQDNSGGSGLSKMRFSNDGLGWSNPEDYTTSRSWALQPGDGTKTVYVKFSDVAGNWSGSYSSGIILDTTPPTTPVVTDDGASTPNTTQLHCSWSSSDSGSGIEEYQYRITEGSTSGTIIIDWTSAGTSTEVTKSGLSLKSTNTYYFSIKAKDGAGLWSTIGSSDGITVVATDTTPPTGSIKINNDSPYTSSTSVTLILSAEDNPGGSGLSKMRFSNDNSVWSTPEDYATNKSWTLASGEGTKTVYVKFSDKADNWSVVYSDTVVLDTIPPTGTILINNGDQYTNSASVNLSLTAEDSGSGVSKMQFSDSTTTELVIISQHPLRWGFKTVKVWSAVEAFSPTKIWNLKSGEGRKDLYVKFSDTAGNWSVEYRGRIILDTTSPATPTVTDDGASTPNTTQLHCSWSSSDSGSGIEEYQYRITEGSTSGTIIIDWTSAGTSTEVTKSGLSLKSTNTYYFSIKAKDGAKNWSAFGYSDGITVITVPTDTTPPTGSIKINNGASYTNSTAVTLTPFAQDNSGGSGLSKMRFSNDGLGWSNPEDYTTSRSWALQPGDGTKTVYVKFSDAAGNWSNEYFGTIILDTTPPTIPVVTDDGSSTPNTTQLHCRWSSSDTDSGIAEYQYKISQDSASGTVILDWTYAGTSTEVTKSGLNLTANKSYYFSVRAKNGAEIWSGIGFSDGITVITAPTDTTPPTGSIKINNDNPYTSSTSVTLILSAEDNPGGSGLSKMRFSNDNSTWSIPEDYTTTKSWTLASGEGTKTVYVKFSDKADNWSGVYQNSIVIDTTPPQITGITPTDGSTFYENDTILISPTVSDTDPSPLEYQFYIDGVMRQAWSNLPSYRWVSIPQDKGNHNIKLEVRDTGGQNAKEVELYIFRKPISISPT